MARIRITYGSDSESVYEGAQKWVIDSDGRLHLLGEKGGNLASFNSGTWLGVEYVNSAQES